MLNTSETSIATSVASSSVASAAATQDAQREAASLLDDDIPTTSQARAATATSTASRSPSVSAVSSSSSIASSAKKNHHNDTTIQSSASIISEMSSQFYEDAQDVLQHITKLEEKLGKIAVQSHTNQPQGVPEASNDNDESTVSAAALSKGTPPKVVYASSNTIAAAGAATPDTSPAAAAAGPGPTSAPSPGRVPPISTGVGGGFFMTVYASPPKPDTPSVSNATSVKKATTTSVHGQEEATASATAAEVDVRRALNTTADSSNTSAHNRHEDDYDASQQRQQPSSSGIDSPPAPNTNLPPPANHYQRCVSDEDGFTALGSGNDPIESPVVSGRHPTTHAAQKQPTSAASSKKVPASIAYDEYIKKKRLIEERLFVSGGGSGADYGFGQRTAQRATGERVRHFVDPDEEAMRAEALRRGRAMDTLRSSAASRVRAGSQRPLDEAVSGVSSWMERRRYTSPPTVGPAVRSTSRGPTPRSSSAGATIPQAKRWESPIGPKPATAAPAPKKGAAKKVGPPNLATAARKGRNKSKPVPTQQRGFMHRTPAVDVHISSPPRSQMNNIPSARTAAAAAASYRPARRRADPPPPAAPKNRPPSIDRSEENSRSHTDNSGNSMEHHRQPEPQHRRPTVSPAAREHHHPRVQRQPSPSGAPSISNHANAKLATLTTQLKQLQAVGSQSQELQRRHEALIGDVQKTMQQLRQELVHSKQPPPFTTRRGGGATSAHVYHVDPEEAMAYNYY